MAAATLPELLAHLPLFASLDRDLRERLATACRLRTCAAGELLFARGAPADACYALLEGCVRLSRGSDDGRVQVLHTLAPGQCFAEAAVLGLGRYPASAEVLATPTRLIEIAAEPFLRLFRSDSRLAAAMVGALAQHALQLAERVEELSIVSAEARLARYLLRLPARAAAEGLQVALPMRKKELAAHLAMAPETLSRLLRRWQERGLVRAGGTALFLLDPAALTALAEPKSANP